MNFHAIERISESNPQLFKELKSRLKSTYLTISVSVSFLGQCLSLMVFGNYLNNPTALEWQDFFQRIFLWLSGVGIFALLVVVTYLLIADLSNEQEKGTLNLIRLSPESVKNVLVGKLIGVPIHVYLVTILALPLHFFAGVMGNISPIIIVGFYSVLIASCIFFYSLALLFSLVRFGKGNLKAGLFSAALAIALVYRDITGGYASPTFTPLNILTFFNPWFFIEQSVTAARGYSEKIVEINWYELSIYDNAVAIAILLIANYALWTFWIWQGLERLFQNPTANLFTKAQSYLFTASWQIVLLGLANNSRADITKNGYWANFCILMSFNLALYFILITALTPSRQAVQDWARYRHFSKLGHKSKLWQDLLVGEKSPAIMAIAINVMLASLMLVPWILLSYNFEFATLALSTLAIAIALTLIYASVVQLILLSNAHQRGVVTTVTLAGLAIVPPAFAIATYSNSGLSAWISLFSIVPWGGLSLNIVEPLAIFSACLIQWLGFTILSWQLQRRLKNIGSSKLLKA